MAVGLGRAVRTTSRRRAGGCCAASVGVRGPVPEGVQTAAMAAGSQGTSPGLKGHRGLREHGLMRDKDLGLDGSTAALWSAEVISVCQN